MPKWFNVKKKDDDTGEVYIYGEIVDEKWFSTDVTPTDFIEELKNLGDIDYIDLYVNSYGGNVYAGIAIYNILKRHKAVITAHVDGIAASIASVVIQSADEIRIPKTAMIMVHKPWSIAIGDADEMKKVSEILDQIQVNIEEAFLERGKVNEKKLKDFINNETWFTGEEAVKEGFADTIEPNKKVNASMKNDKIFINKQEINTDHFKHFPKEKFEFVEDKPEDDKTDANDADDNNSDKNNLNALKMLEVESIINDVTLTLEEVI